MGKVSWVTFGLLCHFATAFVVSLPGVKAVRNAKAEVCLTPECVAAASEIIQALDHNGNPCDDFFTFACGGWVQRHPIPEENSRWNQFDVLRDASKEVLREILSENISDDDPVPVNSARNMYSGCMNTELLEQVGLKPLTDLLGQFGGWPMTQSNWSGTFNWQDTVVTARKLFGYNYLLKMHVSVDRKDTERNSIYVDQAPLGLSRSILVHPDVNKKITSSYKTYITRTAKAVRDSLGNTEVTDEQISVEVDDLLAFESRLAKITTPQKQRRNKSRMYNPFFLPELQKMTDTLITKSNYTAINWLKYFSDIFKDILDTIVSPDERIIVVETEYLKKLVTLLDETPLRTIANYVHWRLVRDLGEETNQLMVDIAFNFSKAVYGYSKPEPRWRKCVNNIYFLLGFAVSGKYVEKTFDETAKREAEAMIENLQIAFKELIGEADWMDDKTKEVALEKADAMRKFVAYPDWIKNKTALESYYEGLQINAADHFGNIQNVNTFLVINKLKTLRQPTDHTKWTTIPFYVNAAYSPGRNAITFPVGILQPPFFGKGRLNAMNYGAIGVIIGHEITHGFDDKGRQRDKNGNIASWWTADTLAQYLVRAQCFIDQYSNYTIPELAGTDTPHLNGFNTQGENIADNGGLREAYRAYMNYVTKNGPEPVLPGLEQFTPEQIFFISYAKNWCGQQTLERLQDDIRTDPHSPSKFRVLGPLSNSADFVRSFNCPAGSEMNRQDKCILW